MSMGVDDATGFEMYYVPPGSSPAYTELVVGLAIKRAANKTGVGKGDRGLARHIAIGLVRAAASRGNHRIEEDNLAQKAGNEVINVLRSRL